MNTRKKKKRKKIESSKKIVVFCDTMLASVVIASLVSHFMHYEISNLVTLAGIIAGLCGTGHGFYFWKSKVENCRKYPNVTELVRDGIISINDTGGEYNV